MDSISVLKCSPQEFQNLYHDLIKLGSLNHEKVIIKKNGQISFPATEKKDFFDFNKLDEKTSKFVLEFLDTHLDSLTQQPNAEDLFLKLCPLFEGKPKLDLHKIQQNFFSLKAETNVSLKFSQIYEEAERQCMARAKVAEESLSQTEEYIKELEEHLAFLKKEEQELNDTLLVCKDGTLNAHMKLLQSVVFFRLSNDHLHHDMKKTSLNPDEAKQYKLKFEFLNYNVKVMDMFLQWLKAPEIMVKLNKFDDLLELYLLADFLSDDAFKNACFLQMQKHISENDALTILSNPVYSIHVDLINVCCDIVVKNYKKIKQTPQFTEIRPEHLKIIINSHVLHEDNELEIFKALMIWANAQSKQTGIPVKEILNDGLSGTNLLGCIRFHNFTNQEFIDIVKPLDIFYPESENHWLSYFLQNKNSLHPRFYNLKCKIKNATQATISWNIPAKILDTLGLWNEQKKHKESFVFNNNKWSIEIAKDSNLTSIVIGIIVVNPTIDFDFFMVINNLQLYSIPITQKNIQSFNCNGYNQTTHVKAACYELATLKQNLDPITNSLPLKITIFVKK